MVLCKYLVNSTVPGNNTPGGAISKSYLFYFTKKFQMEAYINFDAIEKCQKKGEEQWKSHDTISFLTKVVDNTMC